MTTTYDLHEYVLIFPPMDGEEKERFAEDLRANGIRQAIVLYRGKILDGRNRYLIGQEHDLPMKFEEYTGDDPLSYVISANLHRRQLTDTQRKLVAGRIANLQHGSNRYGAKVEPQNCGPSSDRPVSTKKAAEIMNVSARGVEQAKALQKSGIATLQTAVEREDIALDAGVVIAKETPEDQEKIISLHPTKRKEVVKALKEKQTPKSERKPLKKDARDLWHIGNEHTTAALISFCVQLVKLSCSQPQFDRLSTEKLLTVTQARRFLGRIVKKQMQDLAQADALPPEKSKPSERTSNVTYFKREE